MKIISKMATAVILGVTSLSGANALTTAEIQAMCAKSDKTVWDAKNNVCVPRAACHSNNSDHAKYCNKFFSDYEAFDTYSTRLLLNLYTQYHYNSPCDSLATGEEANLIGQDEKGCKLNDGSYMSFEFDTAIGGGNLDGVASIACGVFGYSSKIYQHDYNDIYTCVGANEQICNKMQQIAEKVGKVYNTYYLHYEYQHNTCQFTYVHPAG